MMRSFIRVPAPLATFFYAVMERKHDDHHASHNDAANQLLHLLSSGVFLICYVLVFRNLTLAMWLGVTALLLRQFGHAVLEPDSHEAEKQLLGYNTRNKSLILLTYLLIPAVDMWRAVDWTTSGFMDTAPLIAQHWFRVTMAVVGGRVVFLALMKNMSLAMVWLVKLVTDPLTDLLEYRRWRAERSAT